MFLQENETYSMKDLAEWFKLSYNTIRKEKYKERKYEELKKYADYTREGNNVTIVKVHCAEYIKKEVIAILKEEFEQYWPHSQWCSGALAARRLMQKYPEIDLKPGTIADKINTFRKVDFAIPDKKHLGEKGYSEKGWVKKIDNYTYQELSTEEKVVFNSIKNKIFGSTEGVIPTYLYELQEGKTHKEAWESVEEEFNASSKGAVFFNTLRDNFGTVVHATKNTMCLGADRILFIQGLEEQNEREGQEFTRWMADMGYYADEVRD